MPTFPRGHSNRNVHTGNARMIVKLAPAEKPKTTARYTFTASDGATLRGIPCLAKGVGSAIPGTSPHVEGVRRADRKSVRSD